MPRRSLRPSPSGRPARRSLPPRAAGAARPAGGALRSPAAAVALRQIARSHGDARPGLLEALLDDVAPERLQELSAAWGTADLVDRAQKVVMGADRVLREAPHPQRAKLRGFSGEMLALAADQTFRLTHLQERLDLAAIEYDRAKAEFAAALVEARTLADQGSTILQKVHGSHDAVRAILDVEPPASLEESKDEVTSVTWMLMRLTHAGERVTADANAKVKNRMILYGMDRAYLETLGKRSVRLTELSARIKSGGDVPSAQRTLDEARGITAFLVEQIVGAFATAHQLDPAIPALAEPWSPAPQAAISQTRPAASRQAAPPTPERPAAVPPPLPASATQAIGPTSPVSSSQDAAPAAPDPPAAAETTSSQALRIAGMQFPRLPNAAKG